MSQGFWWCLVVVSKGNRGNHIRNAPCFAVWAVVCDLSPKAECVPAFTRESERGPFVREVEKRDEKRFETELVPVTFWRYSWKWIWAKSRTLQEGFLGGEGRSILAQTGYVFVKQKFRLGYTAHIPCCLS